MPRGVTDQLKGHRVGRPKGPRNFETLLTTPQVKEWADSIDKPKTRELYLSQLYRYWNYLSGAYPSIIEWVQRIRQDQKSDENNVRTHWALELKHYMKEFVSKRTGRGLSSSAKQSLVAAVKSFLKHFLGEAAVLYDFKLEPTVEELQNKERTAMSFEEAQALYKAARTPRDKAIVLCLANTGMGPAEFIQFTATWKRWWTRDMKAPFRVSLVREKKRFPYHVTLWEDCIASLKDLYNERVKQTGGDFESLFVNQEGRPFTQSNLDEVTNALRERAGLYESHGRYQSQRVRSHAFRHYFRTQARLHGVDSQVAEFCLGHKPAKGDHYGYDRSHLEPQWVEIVERELSKMTGVFNLVTGRAQAALKDRETELIAKAAKTTYKTLLESGALKPENLSEEVLKIVAKAVGVAFEKLVLAADEDTLLLPKETQMRLGYFDLIARAVDLSTDTYHKYWDALKVMKPTKAKTSWENHEWLWLRVEIGSDDYMQALADGFEVVDSEDGGVRILRKPKPKVETSDPSISDTSKTATGVGA